MLKKLAIQACVEKSILCEFLYNSITSLMKKTSSAPNLFSRAGNTSLKKLYALGKHRSTILDADKNS
jgi:hypothetical protein